jgi:hypothetical protein
MTDRLDVDFDQVTALFADGVPDFRDFLVRTHQEMDELGLADGVFGDDADAGRLHGTCESLLRAIQDRIGECSKTAHRTATAGQETVDGYEGAERLPRRPV